MSHDAYSALSDPTRRRILAALQDGARPVGELVTELEVSQPTVSKHLKVLRDARMVSTRAQGQKRFYSIAPEPLEEVVAWLGELVAAAGAADPAEGTTPPAPAPAPVPPVPPVSSDDAAAQDGHPAEPEDAAAVDAAHSEGPAAAEAAEPGEAVEETAAADIDAAIELPDPDGSAPELAPVVQESVPSSEEDRSPAIEPAPERSVPWFTAEVTEVTEEEEAGTGVVPASVEDAPGAGMAGHEPGMAERESGTPALPDAEDEAAEHRTGFAETDPAADRESEDLETTAEHSAEPLPDAETPVTPASVEHDVPADARAQSDAARETGPRDPAGSDPSESAELLRPRGGAHRRQSGLLSTLTGFRRRGRGTRRD